MAKKLPPGIDSRMLTRVGGEFRMMRDDAERLVRQIPGARLEHIIVGGRKMGFRVLSPEGEAFGYDIKHHVKKTVKEIAETTFRFDAKLPDAARVAQRQAAMMVTQVSKETERNIRNLIVKAITDGIAPQEAARAIRQTVGLNSAQGQAAMKYRTALLDTGLALDKVEKAFERYTDKLLSVRAETIARTEIMDALNEGKSESFLQAQADGYLTADATEVLITDPDACEEICLPLSGTTVPLGGEWEEGRPPFHPRCRCTTVIGTP